MENLAGWLGDGVCNLCRLDALGELDSDRTDDIHCG
jgi:hypothetical protein